MRTGIRALACASFVLSTLVAAAIPTLACARPGGPGLAGPTVYHAAGVIKSFGPGRAFVNIAHDDIPGYMNAMTMSFEAQRPGDLDGFSERDRIEFEFQETEDARRVLTRIAKRP
ncbi:MAG: copper-binding protein [Polyangiaceae bacterium]